MVIFPFSFYVVQIITSFENELKKIKTVFM